MSVNRKLIHFCKDSPLAFGGIETVVKTWMEEIDSFAITSDFRIYASQSGEIQRSNWRKFLGYWDRKTRLLIHWPSIFFIMAFVPLLRISIFFHGELYRDNQILKLIQILFVKVVKFRQLLVVCHNSPYFLSGALREHSNWIEVVNLGENVFSKVPTDIEKSYDFIFIGRDAWYKNIPDFELAVESRPDLRFACITNYSFSKTYTNLTVFRGICDDDKVKLLCGSKFLVLPSDSRAEAFGIVLSEAKQVGVPVIYNKKSEGVSFVGGSMSQGGLSYHRVDKYSLLSCINENVQFCEKEYCSLRNGALEDYQKRLSRSVFRQQVSNYM